MNLIKYWKVKIYQSHSLLPLMSGHGGVVGMNGKLIEEGYSITKPVFDNDTQTIEILTSPDGIETLTLRTQDISRILCTPVYQDPVNEIQESVHKAKNNLFTISIKLPSNDEIDVMLAKVCEETLFAKPSPISYHAVFEEMLIRVRNAVEGSLNIPAKG